MPPDNTPDCKACAHYSITHDSAFPYGCRRFAFKSRRRPALDVLESSGLPCMMFQAKAHRPGGGAANG